MNSEHLVSVAEDLNYFHTEWADSVSREVIRRGSAILRRLLVEKELGRAWRAVGSEKEPIILGANLDLLIRDYDRNEIYFALAGGAHREGLLMGAFCMCTSPPPERKFDEGESLDNMMNYPFTLSQYVESACALVEGEPVKRRELIKYMANIRGGVHITGAKLRPDEQEIIRKVSNMDKKINDHVLDGLGFELLSIGQSIGRSPDVHTLIEKITSLYPVVE